MPFYRDLFVRHFREWVGAACDAWGYSQPREEFFHRVLDRLSDPIVDWIGYGIHAELVVEESLIDVGRPDSFAVAKDFE